MLSMPPGDLPDVLSPTCPIMLTLYSDQKAKAQHSAQHLQTVKECPLHCNSLVPHVYTPRPSGVHSECDSQGTCTRPCTFPFQL